MGHRIGVLERIKFALQKAFQTQIAAAGASGCHFPRRHDAVVHSCLTATKSLLWKPGRHAANAQHFAASMINRFETGDPVYTRHCTKYR